MNKDDRKLADIIDAVITDRLLERLPNALPLADKKRAFDWFVTNANRIGDLSRHGLVTVAETLRLNPADWQARISANFLPEPRQMRLPPAPLIVPPVKLTHRIFHGRCEDVVPTLAAGSVDLCLTSPPYADQMRGFFDGVSENEMPGWLADRMDLLRPGLKPTGSLVLNIGTIIKDDRESPYIQRCLAELERRGWILHRTMVWAKPNAAPMGRYYRPRKSFEFLHWLSVGQAMPYCNPIEVGRPSQSIGMTRSRLSRSKHPIASYSPGRFAGTARVTDVFTVAIGSDRGWPHPSKMPLKLAEMLIRTFAPRHGTVLDPFSGSGTTVLAAFGAGRSGIGIEVDRGFYNMSLHRLREARKAAT